MKRQDFRFFHPLRVRWAEVDMQKIVFNAHYLMYFDTAIADYWRALALPYSQAMDLLGGDLYVKKATLEYHASAHFDDRLEVALRMTRVGNSSMAFSGAIFRSDELLVTCELFGTDGPGGCTDAVYRARESLGERLHRKLQWEGRDELLNGELF